MNWVYCFRLLNALLAGSVVGLCFLKIEVKRVYRARTCRILGLGILSVVIAWGSLASLTQAFNYRVPSVTLGLLFCFYGMRRIATGERGRPKP